MISEFGEYSPAAKRLGNDIIDGKIEVTQHLRSAIASDTVTLEMARVCLEAERRRLDQFTRSKRASIMRSEDKDLARLLMTHLWTDEQLWVPLVSLDTQNTDHLCFFAVFEGLESFLVDWLCATVAQPIVPKKSHIWRGFLLRGLVQAHVTLNLNSQLDEAIECMFRVVELQAKLTTDAPAADKPPIKWLSSRPVVASLRRQIMTGHQYNTGEKPYNRFCAFTRNHIQKSDSYKIGKKLHAAALNVHHPTTPSHGAALAFFKAHVQETLTPADLKILRNSISISNTALKIFISRASELALCSEKPADAVFIKEQGLRLQAVSTLMPYDRKEFTRSRRWRAPTLHLE